MSIDITKAAELANQALNKSPNIVLKIEGYDTLLSAVVVRKLALYGDDIFYGDEDLVYGGSIPVDDQENLISFQKGTTKNFSQQINIETGVGSSVLSYQVALIDKNQLMTELITPGLVLEDILGQACEVHYGFESTVFPDDYVKLFKGTIDEIDSGSGIVTFNIAASQKKQLANSFLKAEGEIAAVTTQITAGISSIDTVIPCASLVDFYDPITTPSTIQIDSEEITYTGISGSSLTGCVRGVNGTSSANHSNGALVTVLGISVESTKIIIDDATLFFAPVVGPDGITIDPAIEYHVRIDDEIIRYTGITGNELTGVIRGRLGTIPGSHSNEAGVEAFIRLTGDAMDLTLKFMMSGFDGAFASDLEIENFEPTENEIFFKDQNLKRDYNITKGDFLTVTGASIPANNITKEPITSFEVRNDGLGFNVGVAAALDLENDSSAVASIESQYNVFGPDRGLRMVPDEVDVDRHTDLKDSFLAGVEYDFYLDDSIENGKDFIDKQLYNPISCFGLTRSARASVGLQSPPLPFETIRILDASNVNNADKLKIKRSSSKNFFNGAVYKMDARVLDTEKFQKRENVLSGPSIAKFNEKIPFSFLVIDAKGFRAELGSRSVAQSLGKRRLAVYEFGAEFLKGVKVNLSVGLTIEAGDIVLLDLTSLQISDKESGTRRGEPRLFRVDRRGFDIEKGKVTLDLIDSQFNKDARFSLIGPSSKLKTGLSSTEFIIEQGLSDKFGDDEFLKWKSFIGVNVVIRDANFTQVSVPVKLEKLSGNTVTTEDIGFTPTAGMVMEMAPYSDLGLDPIVDTVKILFASVTDDENDFPDGKPAYQIS